MKNIKIIKITDEVIYFENNIELHVIHEQCKYNDLVIDFGNLKHQFEFIKDFEFDLSNSDFYKINPEISLTLIANDDEEFEILSEDTLLRTEYIWLEVMENNKSIALYDITHCKF